MANIWLIRIFWCTVPTPIRFTVVVYVLHRVLDVELSPSSYSELCLLHCCFPHQLSQLVCWNVSSCWRFERALLDLVPGELVYRDGEREVIDFFCCHKVSALCIYYKFIYTRLHRRGKDGTSKIFSPGCVGFQANQDYFLVSLLDSVAQRPSPKKHTTAFYTNAGIVKRC